MRYHVLKDLLGEYRSENSCAPIYLMEAEYLAAATDLRNASRDIVLARERARQASGSKLQGGSVKDKARGFDALARHAAPASPELLAAELRHRESKERLLTQRWRMRQFGARFGVDGRVDWQTTWHALRWGGEIRYNFYPSEREAVRVHFNGSRLYQLQDGISTPLSTEASLAQLNPWERGSEDPSGVGIYVLDARGSFFAMDTAYRRRHSTLLAGQAVAGAGEWRVQDGQLKWISQNSGHYRPNIWQMLQVVHQLDKLGINSYRLEVLYPGMRRMEYERPERFLEDVGAFGLVDYDTMKLLLYSPHLLDEVLAPQGWHFVGDPDFGTGIGVYKLGSDERVLSKTVRRWLKSTGRQPSAANLQAFWGDVDERVDTAVANLQARNPDGTVKRYAD